MGILPYLHSITFITYIYLAFYISSRDPKSRLNRSCSMLILCFAIWSFGQIFIHNPLFNKDFIIIISNICSIGWIGFAFFGLNFFIVFTGTGQRVNTGILLAILSIVPLILLYQKWGGTAMGDHYLQSYGWKFIWNDTPWPFVYYAYYLSYVSAGCILCLIFIKKTRSILKKKQAVLILIFTVASVVIGTFTDVVLVEKGYYNIPDISNITSLIWGGGLVFAIVRYRFLAITPATVVDNIISTIPDSLIICNQDEDIIFVNDRTLDLLNYHAQDLLGKPLDVLYADAPQNEAGPSLFSEGKTPRQMLFASSSGQPIPISMSLSTLRDDNGTISGAICVVTDMTDYINALDALKESTEKYDSLFNNPLSCIYIHDFEGNFLDANDASLKLLGYSREEIPFQNFLSIVSEDYLHQVIDITQKLIQNGKPERIYEFKLRSKDNRSIWIEALSSLVYMEKKPVAVLGVARDITLRKEADQRLKESEARYRLVTDNMLDMVAMCDPQMRFTYVSPSYKTVLGYDPDDLMGLPIFVKVHSDDLPQLLVLIEKRRQDQKPASAVYRMQNNEGKYLWFETQGIVVTGPDGNPAGGVFSTREITERKKAEEELNEAKLRAEESDRFKSVFLANMSHEIRTPLSAIIGSMSLLLNEKMTQSQREYIDIINNSSHLLLSIVNDILDISKLQVGQLDIEHIPFSLETVFDNVDSTSRMLAAQRNKKLAFRRSYPQNISSSIYGDPIRIQQVLNNLMSNAVKFTNEGFIEYGTLLRDSDILEIYVRDTGIGIPEESREKIFLRFQQGDLSVTRQYGGTGLGLAISKKLVELMGGELKVQSSTGSNHGSTFYFTLPYEPAENLEKDEVDQDTNNNHNGHCTILLVEDDHVSQKITQRILEKEGFTVIISSDGRDGISRFKTEESIDLILLDIQMPVIDGYEVIRIIREYESKLSVQNSIPIIVLTAGGMEDDRKKSLEAGADDFISKPVHHNVLKKIIRKHQKDRNP